MRTPSFPGLRVWSGTMMSSEEHMTISTGDIIHHPILNLVGVQLRFLSIPLFAESKPVAVEAL